MAYRYGWSFSFADCGIQTEQLVAIVESMSLLKRGVVPYDRPLNTGRGEVFVRVFENESGERMRLSIVHEFPVKARHQYFCSLGSHLVGEDDLRLGIQAASYAKDAFTQVSKIAPNHVRDFELDCDGTAAFCQQYHESFEVG